MSGNPSRKPFVRRALISVILICVAVMLEFAISNYRNLFIDTDEYVTDFDCLDDTVIALTSGKDSQHKIKDLPSDIYAIRICSSVEEGTILSKPVKVLIKAYDEKRGGTLSTIATTYIAPGNGKSSQKTVYLDLAPASDTYIQFSFSDVTDDVTVSEITINPSRKLITFNFARMMILLAIGLIIWGSISFKLNSEPYDPKKFSHNVAVIGTVSLCIIFTALFCAIFVGGHGNVEYPLQNGVNTYNPYVQQTDAFLKGQLNIDYPVSDSLLELKNPYDYSARDGIYYLWDRAMYDGKYYSYFGIAPILNVYLPHYLLSGSLPSENTVISFYALSAVLFSALFVIAYVTIYKKKVPVSLLCLGIVALLFSSNILLMARGVQHFYYIASIAGMAYLAEFMFFILLAVNSRHRIRRPIFFALAGLSYAMLFLSRLNMALLTAFAVVPILIFGVIISRPEIEIGNGKRIERSTRGRFVDLCALGAFVAVALVFTFWYNNARFDNPFEFGTKYQLTVSDISKNKLRFSGISGALYHYFIQPLGISGNFPNFTLFYSNLYNYGTYVYVDTGMGLFSIPVMLGLILALPFALDKKKTTFAKSLVLSLISGFFIISFVNFCLGGVIFRYTSDMTLLAAVVSILLMFSFNENMTEANGTAKACRITEKMLMLVSIFVCFSVLVSINGNLAGYDARVFVWLAEFFGH